jgi:hypothetical protein
MKYGAASRAIDMITRSSICATSVALNKQQSCRHSWLSKCSHVRAPGLVESILCLGTRHLGSVSSATVEVGLDTFFLDRVLPLTMGLDSES